MNIRDSEILRNSMPFKILLFLFISFVPLYYFFFQSPTSTPQPLIEQKYKVPSPPKALVNPISLDTMFADDHTWTNTLPREKKITVIATGDVLLARSVNYKTVTTGNFIWPFEKTAEVLKRADFTFVNLETPLIEQCPLTVEGTNFCGDSRNVAGLLFAGVDIVNLANNHAANYGLVGVQETIRHLNTASLIRVGISGPVYQTVRGVTVAFLGYNEVNFLEGVQAAEHSLVSQQVAEANAMADIVIVQFHWGNEYTMQITPNQQTLAHLAIDAGADLIIGNHPHWIQPIEIYKGKVIVYAHGNFIFDQEWSIETKQGIVGRYIFFEGQLIDAEFLPIQIEYYGQPYFLADEAKSTILKSLRGESETLKAKL